MRWTVIVPATGPFSTIDEAAHAERAVDWVNPRCGEDAACTLSFAAQETTCSLNQAPDTEASTAAWAGAVPDASAILLFESSTFERNRATLQDTFGEIDAPARAQSYVIKHAQPENQGSRARYLVLGADRTGALYGAYDLLQRMGFRWYGPDPWDTEVPEALIPPVLDWPATEAPSFETRGFISGRRGGERMILWMARNRLNLWSPAPEHAALCRKLGMRFMIGGHDTGRRYLPPDRYFADHPEWYALHHGERQRDLSDGTGFNLCFSNAAMRAELAETLVRSLAQDPEQYADFVNVWPLDNGNWCECDACQTLGNKTDQLLALACDCCRAMDRARQAGRLKRDVKVVIPAYHETLDAPTKPLPPDFDHDRLVATFFPIERCYAHAFANPRCTEINKDLHRYFQSWSELVGKTFRGSLMMGEYYNVSSFTSIAVPLQSIMAADIPYYHAAGVRHMHYMHVTVMNWGSLCLTNGLYSALLWDHELDASAYLQDYWKRRYKGLAERMEQFYTVLEKAMRNAKPLKHYAGMRRHRLRRALIRKQGPIFSTEHFPYLPRERDVNDGPSFIETIALLNDAEAILDQALLDCPDDPVLRQRVSACARRFRYTRNMVRFYYSFARLRMFEEKRDRTGAELEALRLRDYGETLRREMLMPKGQSPRQDPAFDNGLAAAWLGSAYARAMADYGLNTPNTPGGALPQDFDHNDPLFEVL